MHGLFLGVLLCVGYSQAVDVMYECTNGNKTTTTFTPYNDGVVGRYLVEWCIDVNPKTPPTAWDFRLNTFTTDYYCKHPPNGLFLQGRVHSSFTENIELEGNCSHVCLSATVDLIFSACYILQNSFLMNGQNMRNITEEFVNINNTYTEDDFLNNTPTVEIMNPDSENITIVWHTGVPFSVYEFELSRKSNVSSILIRLDVETNCFAPSDIEVRCSMRLPPGEYPAELNLFAPWNHGMFRGQQFVRYTIKVKPPMTPSVQAPPAWPWATGALVVVIVLGVIIYTACRSRETRNLHKKVLKEWLNMRTETNPEPSAVNIPQRHVLLLYAREGAVAAKFCVALRDMLQEAPDTQVYDIFSPEVMSMAASGPHAWIRGMLQRSDVAVLLLQTPALAALYQQQLHESDNMIKLQEPLLGRRLLYRAPLYGDTLLQYAVMLTAEAAHANSNYHKYYIATLSELPTEIFPQLVPFRRYELPGAAPLLAHDLCGVTPSQHSLNTLSTAAREFADLARDNPDYLMDELMLLS